MLVMLLNDAIEGLKEISGPCSHCGDLNISTWLSRKINYNSCLLTYNSFRLVTLSNRKFAVILFKMGNNRWPNHLSCFEDPFTLEWLQCWNVIADLPGVAGASFMQVSTILVEVYGRNCADPPLKHASWSFFWVTDRFLDATGRIQCDFSLCHMDHGWKKSSKVALGKCKFVIQLPIDLQWGSYRSCNGEKKLTGHRCYKNKGVTSVPFCSVQHGSHEWIPCWLETDRAWLKGALCKTKE